MRLLTNLWNYCKLSYHLHDLYTLYTHNQSLDSDRGYILIDTIKRNVEESGSICIKFCQWLIPILDNIYIKGDKKPYWFRSLESLYENCPLHSQEYSKRVYENEFNEGFDDDYTILDIIGSGSIGQVYKIQNKHTDKIFAYKIIHPDVKYQLKLFRTILRIMLAISFIRDKLHRLVPVNYIQFIDNFEEQINMIKESNNLLRMNYNYQDNPAIIIPQLIRCSESCMIMTYEEGVIMDTLDVSAYQKTKIISLLYGFVSTNQLFDDIMHNDIHKANWKVRKINEDRHVLIIYDFGFCHRKRVKDRPIIQLMTELCETADENTDNTEKCTQMIQFFIDDYTESTKESILHLIPSVFKADPNHIFELVINVCNECNTIIDASGIQILITSIQTYKYLKEAGINNGNNLKNDGYRMYRERYLDLCNIYKTYECFHEFRDYMIHKLSTLNMEVTNLFDVIKDNETITDEVTKLLKFD